MNLFYVKTYIYVINDNNEIYQNFTLKSFKANFKFFIWTEKSKRAYNTILK